MAPPCASTKAQRSRRTSDDAGVGAGFYAVYAPAAAAAVTATPGALLPIGYGDAQAGVSGATGTTLRRDLELPAGRLRLHPAAPSATVELGTIAERDPGGEQHRNARARLCVRSRRDRGALRRRRNSRRMAGAWRTMAAAAPGRDRSGSATSRRRRLRGRHRPVGMQGRRSGRRLAAVAGVRSLGEQHGLGRLLPVDVRWRRQLAALRRGRDHRWRRELDDVADAHAVRRRGRRDRSDRNRSFGVRRARRRPASLPLSRCAALGLGHGRPGACLPFGERRRDARHAARPRRPRGRPVAGHRGGFRCARDRAARRLPHPAAHRRRHAVCMAVRRGRGEHDGHRAGELRRRRRRGQRPRPLRPRAGADRGCDRAHHACGWHRHTTTAEDGSYAYWFDASKGPLQVEVEAPGHLAGSREVPLDARHHDGRTSACACSRHA